MEADQLALNAEVGNQYQQRFNNPMERAYQLTAAAQQNQNQAINTVGGFAGSVGYGVATGGIEFGGGGNSGGGMNTNMNLTKMTPKTGVNYDPNASVNNFIGGAPKDPWG